MSDNVELVIGARNEAKAVLEELGSQLRDLAVPAQQSSAKMQAALSGLISRLAYTSAAVVGAAGTAAVGIASVLTASAVKGIKDEADAMDTLSRKIRNYVADSRISIDTHKAFADSLNRSLGVSEKDTLLLLDKAITLGVTEDRLQDAAIGAIGLAKALEIDLNSALVKVINGDADLVSMTDSVNRGLNEQATQIEGVAGVWTTLESVTKSALESAASALEPVREKAVEVGDSINESLIAGIVGLQTSFELMGEYATVAFTGVDESWNDLMQEISEAAMNAFTVVIPAYVNWFSENTRNLFNDTLNAIAAMVQNWSRAIGEAIVSLWTFVASGGEGGIEKLNADIMSATATLLDGFVATTSDLPQILKKQLEDSTADLSTAAGALGANMYSSFTERFTKNLEALKVTIPQVDDGTLSGLKTETQPVKGVSGGFKEIQAVESRLLTRGRSDNTMDKIAASTKTSAERLASIDENLKQTEPSKSIQLEVVG